MKLKHVDMDRETVFHDAREVRTKFAKTFTSNFFPVGDDIRAVVADWIKHLRSELLFGDNDPLFPATAVKPGASRNFEVVGLSREHWSNTTPIRKVFRAACSTAGLPYFNPHSFRKTLARLGEQLCRAPEQFKSWSQNLGHDQVMTTFQSYGSVPLVRQTEIMQRLARPDPSEDEIFEQIRRLLPS